MICGRCGGFNTGEEKCPECGRLPNSAATGEEKQDVSLIAPQLATLNIPKAYLGKKWNTDTFWSSHESKRADRLVRQFVEQLERVQNTFASGYLPNRSALFVAPAGYSKMVWAYSCMQYAVTNRYSVAPILDTLEIKRLLVLAAERPKAAVMNIDYDQYIEADVLFFTVTKTEFRRNAADIIAELMDKRARRGKGTIGISRASLAEISQWDAANTVKLWKEPVDPVDFFKVPAYITCL